MRKEISLPILREQKRITREYYELPFDNKLGILVEIEKFLEKHKLSKLTQEEIENLNRPITGKRLNNLKTSHKEKPSLKWLPC